MKRYYVPNILSEAEFDDLRKKADTGDAVAQLQVSLACDTGLRKLAEVMYAGDYRFYSEEQRNELRDFAYDDLHKAKALAHYKCVGEDKVFKYLKMMKRKGLEIPPLPEDYRP